MYSKSIFNREIESDLKAKRRKLLIIKLNAHLLLNIPIDCKVKEWGTSREWQRSLRKRWTFDTEDHYLQNIGSTQTVFELSKCDNFSWGSNYEIIGW